MQALKENDIFRHGAAIVISFQTQVLFAIVHCCPLHLMKICFHSRKTVQVVKQLPELITYR